MKRKTYYDIEYSEITDKQKKDVLKNFQAIKENGLEKGEYYYILKNGQVLYEMVNIKNYLFSSKIDYEKFINYSTTKHPTSQFFTSYSHPITDKGFIDHRTNYITSFEKQLGIKLDFNDIKTLQHVDIFLNKLNVETIKRLRIDLIAVVGEFLINNMKNAQWKWVNIPSQGRLPMVISDKEFIDPANLIYTELNKKIAYTNQRISLYRQVVKYIH